MTLDGKTVERTSRLITWTLNGNGRQNRDDAQALLDYIAGNRDGNFCSGLC